MYYLGLDLGSSSIKVALVESTSGKKIGLAQVPDAEMAIDAPHKGWAEQDPSIWWGLVCEGIKKIKEQCNVSANDIKGVGIAYQMHGLVIVDEEGNPLRKSIIWCDSRAVAIGKKTYQDLGESYCDEHLLNSPGNFTASKLAWVKQNEPDVFKKIHKFMLPGDYVAFRLTNKINTTISGLSEGILWDFKKNHLSENVLAHYDIPTSLVPEIAPTFGKQSSVSKEAAKDCGLNEGTPILYRAGDQPNNALSLNIFNPGEVAATGGTSGVMYAVTDNLSIKEASRVNNFAHVNYDSSHKRIGKLLCINGSGILYRWLLNNLAVNDYCEMNDLSKSVPVGSDGVIILPFGNGAERMLLNQNIGARMVNIDLNRHTRAHLCRAALEGIAFSFVYGFEIMKSDGIEASTIRAGNDNLFRSKIFGETIASLINRPIEIYDTTGAIGAARACSLQHGDFEKFSGFLRNDYIKTFEPNSNQKSYLEAYNSWKNELHKIIKN